MMLIPDDPIIQSIEQTGFPPWIDPDFTEDEENQHEEDEQCQTHHA